MSSHKYKKSEELRRYDILKGIVAVLIAILLLISIAAGKIDPDDLYRAGGAAAAETPPAAEISAPELNAPEPGAELVAGLVPFSGTGTAGSSVAVAAGGRELGRAAVAANGAWEVVVDLSPDVAEIELQALAGDGSIAARSPGIPLTVVDGRQHTDEAAAVLGPEIDAPPAGLEAGDVILSGSGQPGTTVLLTANGQDIGTTIIGYDGAWSLPATLPEGSYEITAATMDENGAAGAAAVSVAVTVRPGEPPSPAPQAVLSQLPIPDFNPLTGSLVLSGSSEPWSRVGAVLNGQVVEEGAANSNGQWQFDLALAPGTYDLAFAHLDDEGAVRALSEAQTINLPGRLPVVTLPAYALPDDLLAKSDFAGIKLPGLLLPAGDITWEGRAKPGSEVAVLVDGQVVDTAAVDAAGGFSMTGELEPGDHTVQLGIVGEDGEFDGQSRGIQVSAAGQELPAVELAELSSDETTMEISGTAEPGAAVAITVDGKLAGETTAAENGRWSLESEPLPVGTILRAKGLDAEGTPLVQSIPMLLSGLGLQAINGSRPKPASGGMAEATVSGEVSYRERIALPDDAVVTVQIEDVSRQDAPAVVIGEQIIKTNGRQVPIPYEVAYDPAEIEEQFTYNMRARIKDGDGNLLFINDTAIPVITNGSPTENVAIPTVPVGTVEPDAEGAASVTGTVTYKERIALPDDAELTVQLQDISTPGTAAAVLGEQVIPTEGRQVPIPYAVEYDPAAIVEDHTYSVMARIEDAAGNLLFVNDTVTPVITDGNPVEDVQVKTVKVDTAVSDVVLNETADVLAEGADSAVQAAADAGSFSILLEGLQAAGLTETLEDIAGEYTLFAPTDDAFQAIPPQVLEEWAANPQAYADILHQLVVEGAYTPADLTDGLLLTSLAAADIEIARDGDLITANGVPLTDSAEVGNSVVYALPQLLLPLLATADRLPIIDESGVPTFVGPLLTVVGLGEPGTDILLTVDGDLFGEIATVEPDGFWLVTQDITPGIHYILAYMLDDQGLLKGISQEVVLPVP